MVYVVLFFDPILYMVLLHSLTLLLLSHISESNTINVNDSLTFLRHRSQVEMFQKLQPREVGSYLV